MANTAGTVPGQDIRAGSVQSALLAGLTYPGLSCMERTPTGIYRRLEAEGAPWTFASVRRALRKLAEEGLVMPGEPIRMEGRRFVPYFVKEEVLGSVRRVVHLNREIEKLEEAKAAELPRLREVAKQV